MDSRSIGLGLREFNALSKSLSLHIIVHIDGDGMATKKPTKTNKTSRPTFRESKIFDIPNYAQSEAFTSAAACAMMTLKYLNKDMRMRKETEFEIWQEAVNGSVWHGSRYGLAYALAKRGLRTQIITNAKDEGYEKKLAVYEGINLETLSSSFNEIKNKAKAMKITEQSGNVTLSMIKKQLTAGKIPIVLINANTLNPYLEPSPHWVVIKGYDKDAVYINDPYSANTITMEQQVFKNALGYDGECHMIAVSTRK